MNSFEEQARYRKVSDDTILRAVEACFLCIDNIKLKVFQMSKSQREKQYFSEKNFSELIDMLDVFIQIVSDIYRVLKRQQLANNFCVKTVQALEVHMLFILKALVAARDRKDFVMLMDLLEHELIENIIQWKIRVVPELKKATSEMESCK